MSGAPKTNASRTWADCRTEQDRQSTLALALEITAGNRTRAAALLQMNRQHLQDVLARYARLAAGVGPVGVVGRSDSSDTEGADGRVGPTILPSLTYWLPAPTFRSMSSAVAVTDEAKITIGLPKPLKDWLERKALDQKQASGGRFAVSPVIVEILEAQRLREEQGE
jgi:hypothetical protein